MKTTDLLEKASEILNELNVTITNIDEDENKVTVDMQFYSPKGQDFNFSIEMCSEVDDTDEFNQKFTDAIDIYADNYDVCYETYIWLDEFGHGKNGAPYNMRDLYNDNEWCKNRMETISSEFYKQWNEMDFGNDNEEA